MKSAVVVLAGGTLLLASAALAQDAGTLKAIYEGRALYVAHCAQCHGNVATGEALGTNGNCIPDLTGIALRDGGFNAVHVANHISGRHNGESVTRTMPVWVRHLKEEWPNSDAMAQLKVAWLAQYLASAQQTPAPRR
jgi:mono/diheme cytochrome c family protein